MPTFEDFTKDDYSELTRGVRWFADRDDLDISAVREDGEVIGGSVIVNEEDYSVLRYIEIDPEYRGTEADGKSLARRITEFALARLPEDRTIYAQGTNANGKTQHLMQDEGFEFSGLGIDRSLSEVMKDPGGGFNIDLWNLGNDEELEAYVPDALQDFVDASLRDQREVTYLEPDDSEIHTASMNIIDTGGRDKHGRTVKVDIGEGSTFLHHIKGGFSILRSSDDWAEVVNIDVTEPFAYELSSDFLEAGYRPVNMTPEVAGNRLRMAKIHEDVGRYGLTQGTMDVIKETGLDYEIKEEDELSSDVVFRS